jgi:dGTPase
MKIGATFSANPSKAVRFYDNNDANYFFKFEKDRDRIVQSKEFRRLNGKTQVFVNGFDDHIRNRLTHTFEVAQIAQTISWKLQLNQPLVEAIAYGHDVGHTPFGHVGERALNLFMNGCGEFGSNISLEKKHKGFKHNFQSLRVVTLLERISNQHPGLDLTNYTLWGILNHTGTTPKPCGYKSKIGQCTLHQSMINCKNEQDGLCFDYYNRHLAKLDVENSWTIEALVVRIADEIAQRHHDIEDGLFAGVIDRDEIIETLLDCYSTFFSREECSLIADLQKETNKDIFISKLSDLVLKFHITNLISNTKQNLLKLSLDYSIKTKDDFENSKLAIFMSEKFFDLVNYENKLSLNEQKFQSFLKNRILNSYLAQSMDGKASFIIKNLIVAYLSNPQQLPDGTIQKFYHRLLPKYMSNEFKLYNDKSLNGRLRQELEKGYFERNDNKFKGVLCRTICDFIAGMTDNFAMDQYNLLYGTSNVFKNLGYNT